MLQIIRGPISSVNEMMRFTPDIISDLKIDQIDVFQFITGLKNVLGFSNYYYVLLYFMLGFSKNWWSKVF